MAKETALITGAGSGIGRSLCELLLDKGWRVLAVDKQTDGLVSLSERYGDQLKVFEGDVRESSLFSEILRETEARKQWIDFWVNCAGVNGLGEFSKQTKEEFDRTLQVNLLSVVDLSRLALQHMSRRGKGCICNIASVAGFVPAPLMTAYCLSKHAVVGFSRSLQSELRMARSPVRILLVSPGFVDTDILQKGQPVGFPEWLSPLLAQPQTVAANILRAYRSGDNEIVPTLNGKVMVALQRWAPWVVGRGQRLLTARTLTDVLLNRY